MRLFKKTVITREDGIPYLIRYTLFNLGFISLKLHHILQSDDDCLHDHPWTFLSIILKSGYREHRFTGDHLSAAQNITQYNDYGPGCILYRPAHFAHRLELKPGKTAWTLVFTFKRVREWGFFTRKGWVAHYNYNSTGGCEQNKPFKMSVPDELVGAVHLLLQAYKKLPNKADHSNRDLQKDVYSAAIAMPIASEKEPAEVQNIAAKIGAETLSLLVNYREANV